MRSQVNGTELYFDVEGPELVLAEGEWRRRPTLIVLPGGPGFDQGYLRPGVGSLAVDAQLFIRRPARSGPLGARSPPIVHARADG